MSGIINIILTHEPDKKIKNVFFADSPVTAVKLAEEKGCNNILIAGGSHTSSSFLEAGLIDEIFFSIHPLILGQGIKPFEGKASERKITLIDSKIVSDGLVEIHYKVLE